MAAPRDMRQASDAGQDDSEFLTAEDLTSFQLFHRFTAGPHFGDGRSASGLDAALLILTRVLALLPDKWRSHVAHETDDQNARDTREVVRQHDAANPLLRYLWYDFSGERVAPADLKFAWDALVQDVGRMFPCPSFANIMHGEMMQRTLWDRAPLFLVSGFAWDPAAKALVRDKANDVPYLEWTGRSRTDTRQSLERAIHLNLFSESGRVAAMGSSDDRVRCFRVLYTPSPEEANPWTFEDLKTVMVKRVANLAAEEREALKGMGYEPPSYMYRLFAVVRQRATPDEEDYFRLYTLDGVHTPGPLVPRPGYANDEWRLGNPGHTYALFYARTDVQPLERVRSELHPTESNEARMWLLNILNNTPDDLDMGGDAEAAGREAADKNASSLTTTGGTAAATRKPSDKSCLGDYDEEDVPMDVSDDE